MPTLVSVLGTNATDNGSNDPLSHLQRNARQTVINASYTGEVLVTQARPAAVAALQTTADTVTSAVNSCQQATQSVGNALSCGLDALQIASTVVLPEGGAAVDLTAQAVERGAPQAVRGTVALVGRAPGFRQAVIDAIGHAPTDAIYQAHHVFPVQFERDFAQLGIDINRGEYGSWVEQGLHQGFSNEYAKDWEGFFTGNPSPADAFDFARMLGEKYGFDVHF